MSQAVTKTGAARETAGPGAGSPTGTRSEHGGLERRRHESHGHRAASLGERLEAQLRPAITRRDRRTLEIRHFFPLPQHAEQPVSYAYECYFFFPTAMGVTPDAWPREEFYRAATISMRLLAPSLSLLDLHDLEHPRNPAGLLRKQLPAMLTSDIPSSEAMAVLAQMFGSELADKVTERSKALRGALHGLGDPADRLRFEGEVGLLCREALLALGTLRRLRAKALAYAPVAPPSLMPALSLAEEFASAVVDEQLAKLAMSIEQAPELRDGSGLAIRLRLTLANAVEQVNQRRLDLGFAVPDGTGQRSEQFTYRLELLKKEMQRSLSVDTRTSRRDPFFRNSAAMVGAGLAATWATLAQIQMWESGLQSPNSLLFLAAAVGAYILKDRIKEWVRNWLSRYFLRWDHDQQLLSATLGNFGLGAFNGRAQERMSFVSHRTLPPDIHQARATCRGMKGLGHELETIIRYDRRLQLEPQVGMPVPEGYAIKEALRINLRELMGRLEDPQDKVSFYERSTGLFREAVLPHIYHLPVILVTIDEATGRRTLKGCRLVVDRKRIRRVESVSLRD